MATKKKTNNPLSRKADWTITEFQMWLAGAYSLQGENWVPNAEQWEMIVDIIYKLKNKKAEPAQVSNPVSFPTPSRNSTTVTQHYDPEMQFKGVDKTVTTKW